jgi:hypothetical protein
LHEITALCIEESPFALLDKAALANASCFDSSVYALAIKKHATYNPKRDSVVKHNWAIHIPVSALMLVTALTQWV